MLKEFIRPHINTLLYTNFSLQNIYYSGKALIKVIYVYDTEKIFILFCIRLFLIVLLVVFFCEYIESRSRFQCYK